MIPVESFVVSRDSFQHEIANVFGDLEVLKSRFCFKSGIKVELEAYSATRFLNLRVTRGSEKNFEVWYKYL